MAKEYPENCADLERMMNTSRNSLVRCCRHKSFHRDPTSVGDVITIEHQVFPCGDGTVKIAHVSEIVDEIRGTTLCLKIRTDSEEVFTFEEFRSSEWWEPTLKKWGDGDKDASEIGITHVFHDDHYIEVDISMEKHRQDWLGNKVSCTGFETVSIYADAKTGEIIICYGGDEYAFEPKDLREAYEKLERFEKAGVFVSDDGSILIEPRKEADAE